MGAGLVSAALQPAWASLTTTERLVLVTMCHTALDRTRDEVRKCRYWAGLDYLVLVVDGPLEHGSTEYASALRRIRRAIARLEAAGAIIRESDATARRRASWRILVEEPILPLAPVDNSPVDEPKSTPQGGRQCPPEMDTSVPLKWTPVSP